MRLSEGYEFELTAQIGVARFLGCPDFWLTVEDSFSYPKVPGVLLRKTDPSDIDRGIRGHRCERIGWLGEGRAPCFLASEHVARVLAKCFLGQCGAIILTVLRVTVGAAPISIRA